MSPSMSKALGIVLGSLEKKYGKGTVVKLTDVPKHDPANIIESGSISLNSALGIGGYRRSRIVEIYGPESSGKTTLTLHAIANEQKNGGTCAFIDAEHALDVQYATNLGVQFDNLLVSQPDYLLNLLHFLGHHHVVGFSGWGKALVSGVIFQDSWVSRYITGASDGTKLF